MYALHDLGWTDSHTIEFEPHAAGGLLPARVIVEYQNIYRVVFSERRAARRPPAVSARGGRGG